MTWAPHLLVWVFACAMGSKIKRFSTPEIAGLTSIPIYLSIYMYMYLSISVPWIRTDMCAYPFCFAVDLRNGLQNKYIRNARHCGTRRERRLFPKAPLACAPNQKSNDWVLWARIDARNIRGNCVCIYMYVSIYLYLYLYIHVYIHIYIYSYIIYIVMYMVYIYLYLKSKDWVFWTGIDARHLRGICVFISICMCLYIYIYIYIYIHIYIYIYSYIIYIVMYIYIHVYIGDVFFLKHLWYLG